MIDGKDAAKIARAWAAERIELTSTDWPSGTYDFGSRDDYHVFVLLTRGCIGVGGSHYVGVHKGTGEVRDLGYSEE